MRTLLAALVLVIGCGTDPGASDGPSSSDAARPAARDAGTDAAKDGAQPCTASCSGKMCGSDGCGGMCGTCPMSQLCTVAGTCAPVGNDPIAVDPGSVSGNIRPEIYGLAYADPATLTALNIPVNRWGGNSSTRFNWKLDVHNVGSDYFFENIADAAGSADSFVDGNKNAKAATLLTIPTIGWTPKDRVSMHPFTCGFPVAKYGPQDMVDQYDTNCGSGVHNGAKITGNPTDTSIAAPPSFEAEWLTHLTGKYGMASGGGVRFYQLDNEMMLWDSTHRDVHPMPVTFDEVWATTSSYGPVVKAADPTAFLLGYTTWGVLDLFESGLDTANNNDADKKAHGGAPLAKWYLAQLAAYEKAQGARLVDCLDLHYYPQGGDPLENTRSLWDPAYHDPSWVDQFLGEPVRLFPRVAEWIAAAYPGTEVCVSEYNFNLYTEADPKAALVEADVLGIYGKYGVRLAAYWTTPVDKGNLLPPAYAFKMYRNYDGAGGTFGAISVAAATALPNVAVYAATDANATTTTVVVINKRNAGLQTSLGVANWNAAPNAHAWQYVAQVGGTLVKLPDVAVAGGKLALDLPALSMTLLVIPKQ